MKFVHAVAIAALAAAGGANAQQAATDHSAHHPAPAASPAASSPQSEGEIRKVDLAQGKVTLRHGPLANLDMPAMTMVFIVADRKLLDGVKQGDKVRFTADKVDSAYVVTALQPAN